MERDGQIWGVTMGWLKRRVVDSLAIGIGLILLLMILTMGS